MSTNLASPLKIALLTSTSNAADLLEDHLIYHQALGVDDYVVMDYHSTDGSREILTAPRWRDFVHFFSLPTTNLLEYDPSNEMVRWVRSNLDVDWVLMSDPDEFWVARGGSLRSTLEHHQLDGANLLPVRRYNMTGLWNCALEAGEIDDFIAHNTLRVVDRVRRTPEEKQLGLSSPWIFTHVADKIAVHCAAIERIHVGDHGADLNTTVHQPVETGLEICHFPIRSYGSFATKVATAYTYLKDNPHLTPDQAWHWRRWVRIWRAGELRGEYRKQFVHPDALEEFADMAVGDCRIIDALRKCATRDTAGRTDPAIQ